MSTPVITHVRQCPHRLPSGLEAAGSFLPSPLTGRSEFPIPFNMRNAALPRDLTLSAADTTPARPMPSFWRSRRRRVSAPPVAAPAATLRRVHARWTSDVSGHPTPDHPVLVHDHSLSAVELRSRLPLCVCGHYDLHSDNHGPLFQGSRMRVTSCRREPTGLYAIAAEICR